MLFKLKYSTCLTGHGLHPISLGGDESTRLRDLAAEEAGSWKRKWVSEGMERGLYWIWINQKYSKEILMVRCRPSSVLFPFLPYPYNKVCPLMWTQYPDSNPRFWRSFVMLGNLLIIPPSEYHFRLSTYWIETTSILPSFSPSSVLLWRRGKHSGAERKLKLRRGWHMIQGRLGPLKHWAQRHQLEYRYYMPMGIHVYV